GPDFSDEGFSWSGPEFAQHDKPSSWYLVIIVVGLVLGAIIYVLTRDMLSTISVAGAFIILGLYSLRKPKEITYILTDYDISVGTKQYTYEQFRSFTVNTEGNYLNITFLPLRRFATTAGLYYQGQDEDRLIGFLSDRLPMEKHKPDLIETFMQRIRF
ncbi:MAG TPA: hypothetical protein VFN31_03800, partial [Candidatus Saccharimonadales bacterium]|nr:hypothetical protein [Candidatus Saccharimonadales bacterium]